LIREIPALFLGCMSIESGPEEHFSILPIESELQPILS
jgi:hypothetical protein